MDAWSSFSLEHAVALDDKVDKPAYPSAESNYAQSSIADMQYFDNFD
jgi:hypothetical protein